MKRLKIIAMWLLALLLLSGCGAEQPPETEPEQTYLVDKPVVYLYPETEMEVTVKLSCSGQLTHTYPAYDDGWSVTAKPDGTLTDASGREYYCLFWEGSCSAEFDLSEGFVVPGVDTSAFLEDALATLGLTEREANEFIIYWLPKMEGNAYNLISFQTDSYTENAQLLITPAPDTVLRIFMAWKPLDAPIEVEPQQLESVERTGFTVVEWGGTELSEAAKDHLHSPAEQPQTVENPVSGYCGNTVTTVYLDGEEYSFWGDDSVTMTDILINLAYDPAKLCRCLPEFTVDTEFGGGYGVNLSEGYARCEQGQAELTRQQIETITQIIENL